MLKADMSGALILIYQNLKHLKKAILQYNLLPLTDLTEMLRLYVPLEV
ncbi:hypothetical protein MNV_220021 [Candidatus Methanoperedens nitroreducens]|uniref:Uncharacterized protein n=1 Tax=Candidatus Methanoperedens nitratireducens TaxID=1392998 RepID=A0A284VPC6_9EURY|nr:hypothetical protein MNV_220021 [Candidatus Methanoperedens nitroreducens]